MIFITILYDISRNKIVVENSHMCCSIILNVFCHIFPVDPLLVGMHARPILLDLKMYLHIWYYFKPPCTMYRVVQKKGNDSKWL